MISLLNTMLHFPLTGAGTSESDGCTVEVPIPGYNKSNTKVTVKNSHIVIQLKNEERLKYYVPKTYDIDGIKATMKDGLLTLKIPYHEKTKPKEIKIE